MDFFEKNDVDTTEYVVSSLKVTTIFGIIIWILNIVGIFTIKQSIMNSTMFIGLFIVLIPIFMLKLFKVSISSI